MFLGDDQHVCRRFRVDVFKGEDVGIFVDFLGRNLAAQNAAEEAGSGGVGHGNLVVVVVGRWSLVVGKRQVHIPTIEAKKQRDLERTTND